MTQPLYIVAGQSNAVRVELYTGVEEALSLRGGDATVVHVSQGGTGLAPDRFREDWHPFEDDDPTTGELFADLVGQISALLETGEYHLAGVFWVQGGSDANLTDAPLYEERLQGLYDGLVGEFGTDFEFVIAKASEETPGYLDYLDEQAVSETPDPFDPFALVQDAQENVAAANEKVTLLDPSTIWIEAGLAQVGEDEEFVFADNTFSDRLHYNNRAADAMAEAFLALFDTTETRTLRDGSTVTSHYFEDTLYKAVRHDVADIKPWEETRLYYTDGAVSGFGVTYDDGSSFDIPLV